METRGHGDMETRRQGDKETRGQRFICAVVVIDNIATRYHYCSIGVRKYFTRQPHTVGVVLVV